MSRLLETADGYPQKSGRAWFIWSFDFPPGPEGVKQLSAGHLAAFSDAQRTNEDLIAEGVTAEK